MRSAKISVDLVPLSMWGRNARAVLSHATWSALRFHFGASMDYLPGASIDVAPRTWRPKLPCKLCGAEQKQLELHEEWEYDDVRRVQKLVGLTPICHRCHLAKHLGYANKAGKLDLALQHLAQVNGWSARQTDRYHKQVGETWLSRSSIRYQLDLSWLRGKFPDIRIHMDWLDKRRHWLTSRIDAIAWAAERLKSDALILDTETTGLRDKPDVEVIELAVINMKGRVLYDSLFKPMYEIPWETIQIHGITDRHVRKAPRFAEEFPRINRLLNGKTIITYHSLFDSEVIGNTCALQKLLAPDARWECAMKAFRTYLGVGHYRKLPYGTHRALADARAVRKLMKGMVSEKAVDPLGAFP